MALHPIKTTRHLTNSYIRYLKTIKTFQDDWLRSQFTHAIGEKNALVKGPLLEASPPFEKTTSIKELVEEGVLSHRFRKLCSSSLPFERELYKHQEITIRKIVSGRNIVVSTGTGSGKTEAFLIPILQRLLEEEEEGTLGRPGVRAMLLYPLNALANDQMKRLRRVLKNYPQIKFGRYIGETEYRADKAKELFGEIYPEEPDLENELLSRDEMQADPPHIFLTNYAMLEYLLLRPQDSVFFDGKTGEQWSFIVLDEAHTYDGAKANEIGMLMRRLEQRIVGDKLGRLQGVATSATIGGGESDFPEVVKFAEGLFNLPFEWVEGDAGRQDVVKAYRLPISSLGSIWGAGNPDMYDSLKIMADIWREEKTFQPPENDKLKVVPEQVQKLLAHAGNTPEYLYQLLRGDKILHKLREELEKQPRMLEDLADTLFPEHHKDDAEHAVADLVSASVLAKADNEQAPLLPARYHVFARALEGAFVCLNVREHRREGGSDLPNLFLSRQKFCPYCESRVFELANCTRCGTAYLIGEIKPNQEIEKSNIGANPAGRTLVQNSMVFSPEVQGKEISYFVVDVSDVAEKDEDAVVTSELADLEQEDIKDLEPMELCPVCGEVRGEFELMVCDCGVEPIQVYRIDVGKKSKLQRCVSCSTRSSSSVVYRFLTGQDAPVSVLVDALYQHLPKSRDLSLNRIPGQGRKMLNFTDSRQKAAFFAPYVERTHMRNLRRRLIMKTLMEDSAAVEGDLRLGDLVHRVVHRADQAGIFPEKMSKDARRREISIWLMKEFNPIDRRISLEGVGLVKFLPVVDPNWVLPNFLVLQPWELNQNEAFDLITMLLNTLRRNGAVTYLRSKSENLASDEAFAPRNKNFYIQRVGSERSRFFNVFGWNPVAGYSNSRQEILIRYLLKKGIDEEDIKDKASALLGKIWEYITTKSTPWGKLMAGESRQRFGMLYRIRHDMWRVIPAFQGGLEGWYVCDRCLNISAFNLGGVCSTYGCKGSLVLLTERQQLMEDNLYRDAYLKGNPLPLKAEEHTAQWVTRKAAEVQNRFIKGEINLLSCSTTFELGVDVGDLQSVVMRNVPPSTSNYVQRAGRAGRRTDAAALALTFAQRRPHDLNHYQKPELMVSGVIKPPVTVLQNAKIVRRHLHSVAFARFLRWAKSKFGREFWNIGEFFEAAGEESSGVDLFRDYLRIREGELQEALNQVLPVDQELKALFSIEEWKWTDQLTDKENQGILDQAEKEYRHEIQEFEDLKLQAVENERYHLAGRYKKIQKQIRNRYLFGFLGNRNVLPKYGFPTDVVTLKTDHLQGIPQASQIDLSRDLRMAISEFAPGSQVVAAKRLWHSAGVRKFPGQHWEPYQYVVCPNCERMTIKVGETKPKQCLCGHVFENPRYSGTYIVPEHGFVAAQKTSKPGESPPDTFYSSRVFFANYGLLSDQSEKDEKDHEIEVVPDKRFINSRIPVSKNYSKHGWLAVVNDGRKRGFKICNFCGYTQPVVKEDKWRDEHKDPLTDKECDGGYHLYHFGHRFMTDVLELHLDYSFQNKTEIYSVLYSILSGASTALSVKRDDLDGTVYYREQGPAFIIYDNVPGGAGHVERVSDQLDEVMASAYELTSSCECGEDTSCYNCLRNYRNQYYHDDLARGPAEIILSGVLEGL